MNITRGRKPCAKKIVIYGTEGIGKSTLAAGFPDPVFIDTEESTKHMDVARFDAPTTWTSLLEEIRYVIAHPDCCKTLVLDTADWAEQLELRELCAKNNWTSIETLGYGKGYTYAAEEFGKMLNLLTEVVAKGVNVVITAHAWLRKVELPEETGAYDHWEMKTSKKVAPMLREWADAVFFANYKIIVVNVDGKGAGGTNKAQGGRRMLYTTHTPYWDAKNRFGMPDELPLSYDAIRPFIEDGAVPESAQEAHREPVRAPKPVQAQKPAAPAPAPQTAAPVPSEPADTKQMALTDIPLPPEFLPDQRIPTALRDLMISNHVSEWELENAVEARGFVPHGTKIWDYDRVNPGIIEGLLVPSFDQVLAIVKEIREKQEVPFN